DAVEVQIALEDAGAALHVHPERLPARDIRTLRREQARDQPGADLAAVHVGAMEPVEVVPRRLKIRGFETDERAEFAGVRDRQVQHDAPADRAAQHHRLLELERSTEAAYRLRIG